MDVSLVEVFKHDMCGKLALRENMAQCVVKKHRVLPPTDRLKATQIKSLTQTLIWSCPIARRTPEKD